MTCADLSWQDLCPFWPEAIAQQYRDAGVWRDETFFDFLHDLSTRHGDRVAVIDGDTVTSYHQLEQSALSIAAGLVDLGLRRGDRVVVQMPNSTRFVSLLFALFRLGIVPVLALPAHRDLEIGQFARFVNARACILPARIGNDDMIAMAERVRAATPSMAHIIVCGDGRGHVELDRLGMSVNDLEGRGPWPQPGAEDVACFQISGGTTGVPKLIPRRHMEYLYNIRMATAASRFSAQTRYLCALPVAHNFPLACPGIMGVLSVGGTAVMAPDSSAQTCFELIARHQVTATSLVPPLAVLWTEAAGSATHSAIDGLKSLEVLQVGGSKLNAASAARIRPMLDCQLQQVFGMAEGLICFTDPDDDDRIIHSSQGRPMSHWDEVRVIREDGSEALPGETGVLHTRGPYTIRGYFNMADHNAQNFTEDGFYCSGDIVSRDVAGNITVEGRAKDQVNRGGEKIGVDEIEDLLLRHPDVVDVAVVGRPDEAIGERLCAVILPVVGQKPRAAALRRHLQEIGIAAFKIPDEIIIVDSFPTTGVGKINKRQLRDALKKQVFEAKSAGSEVV